MICLKNIWRLHIIEKTPEELLKDALENWNRRGNWGLLEEIDREINYQLQYQLILESLDNLEEP